MSKLGAIIFETYLPYISDFGNFTKVKTRLDLDLRKAKLSRGGYSESELDDFVLLYKRRSIKYNPRHIICRDIGKVVFKTRELFWEYLLDPENHPLIKTWHGEFGNKGFIKAVKSHE